MNKLLTGFLGFILFFSLGTAVSPAELSVEDSIGNSFDLDTSGGENVSIYGSGTQRYVRVEEAVRVGESFEACAEPGSYGYTFRLKSNGTEHPESMGFNESSGCHEWKLDQNFVEEKLRLSIWARNGDGKFEHNDRSRSDYYIQVLYRDVETVQQEDVASESSDTGLLEKIIGKLSRLINGD